MGRLLGIGGGRAARALRFALLIILALAAVEYMYSYVLENSPLKSYIYPPAPFNNNNNSELGKVRPITRDDSSTITKNSSPPHLLTSPEVITNENDTTISHNNYRLQFYVLTLEQNSTKLIRNSTTISLNYSTISIKNNSVATNNHTKYQNENTILLNSLLKTVPHNHKTIPHDLKDVENSESELPPCTLTDNLGPVTVNKSDVFSLLEVDRKYAPVSPGGIYLPFNCSTQDKVAIIVSFRDRHQNLAHFLNHMHPFLMKQPIEYGIYIVEQQGTSRFNRGKLLNVGFEESQRLAGNHWMCFVFHDVDLLPLDTRNLYTCPRQPRHMSVAIDYMDFKLPSLSQFGGVTALTVKQFKDANGFSNQYWGWGSEDDDLFYRVKRKGYGVVRYKSSIARYATLNHKRAWVNPHRFAMLAKYIKLVDKDGLSNLKYKVIKVQKYHLYTHILANID